MRRHLRRPAGSTLNGPVDRFRLNRALPASARFSGPATAAAPTPPTICRERAPMAVRLPTPTQIRDVARQCGLSLTDGDVDSFRGLFSAYVAAYNLVDAMPDEVPAVKYPRTPGYRPGPEENRHNAWYRRTSIKGASGGKLA